MSREINNAAMVALENQDFYRAQQLLFRNARENPSHNTYNNLGYYLITEGLTCKNGTVRNSLKLGSKYLLRAMDLYYDPINFMAIAKSIECFLFSNEMDKKTLYEFAYKYLERALLIEYSNEVQYNCLRYLYLLDKIDTTFLLQVRMLLGEFVSIESVSLYFHTLMRLNLEDEALECIRNYNALLDPIDLLLFYAKNERYDDIEALIEEVVTSYSADKYIASAILEHFIAIKDYQKAKDYSLQVAEFLDGIGSKKEKGWYRIVFKNLLNSDIERKKIIESYKAVPPFLDICCYYGCPIHSTRW